ncbi:mitochondrial cardiolipin hydrolase [Drosophila novamexicana]|uniref:mitochondrial cardiolipin hydrolase n=1 Tax=Drosophila novamexicana TaxID=47314 RepID=UPI0011E5FE82|nr:mitochondrial cardiolipin hydrolase [Drosophila novamexicana]
MYVWFNNKWAAITIAAATVVVSRLIYATIKYVRSRKSEKEVLNILIFNELSGSCAAKHSQKAPFKCRNKYCTKSHIQSIVHQIDQAQYCIDIAIYTFTIIELFEALKRALRRGVTIRVISDHEMICSSGSKVSSLNRLGVEVRMPRTTAMMHHKFMVIDGGARVDDLWLRDRKSKPRACQSVVVYGSSNWTLQGFNGNCENCVITSDRQMTGQFQAEFDRMWKSFEYSSCNVKACIK